MLCWQIHMQDVCVLNKTPHMCRVNERRCRESNQSGVWFSGPRGRHKSISGSEGPGKAKQDRNKRTDPPISRLEMKHSRGNRGMNGGEGAKVQINTLCQSSCGAQRYHCSLFVPVSTAKLFLPLVKPVVYSLDNQICKSQHEQDSQRAPKRENKCAVQAHGARVYPAGVLLSLYFRLS